MSKGTLKISLKAARVNAGLTQEQTAKKLGITERTYWHWEQDPSQISALVQDKLSDIFDISIDHINFLPKD